jgi:hypothetical protein
VASQVAVNSRQRCAVAFACVASTAVACTSGSHHSRQAAATTTPGASSTCATKTGELPTWARSGFTPSGQSVPYVLGAKDQIVGVLFGYPLRAPPRPDRANKILWVSRAVAQRDPLKIHATLIGSNQRASREVAGGPGPSIVDMPSAGCWVFRLSWSGKTDRVAVPYNTS